MLSIIAGKHSWAAPGEGSKAAFGVVPCELFSLALY